MVDTPEQVLQQLIEAGKAVEAVALATRHLAEGSSLADDQRAVLLHELGRAQTRNRNFAAAELAFAEAIGLQPDQPVYHLNRGIAADGIGDLPAAAAAFAKAHELAPDFAYAAFWRGQVAAQLGEFAGAQAFLAQAAKLQPDNPEIMTARLNLARQLCDWSAWRDVRTRMVELWGQAKSPQLLEGLANPADVEDDLLLAGLSQARADQVTNALTAMPFADWPLAAEPRDNRLRIGYLSANFRKQAGGQLARGLFAAHDREQVHVSAYALPPMDGSRYRRDPEHDADQFVDLTEASTAEAAARIRDDGIQVLIDMKGWTEFNRQDIMALRPAPVQLHYLGYAAPMVAPWIDYQVVDPVLVPSEARQRFATNLIYLPDTYQVNDGAQPLPGPVPERKALGLAEDAIVLAVASTVYKVTWPIFEIWMQVLAARPKAVLWFFGAHQLVQANLAKLARAQGVDPDRIVFSPGMARDDHITRLQAADFALDTKPYGGHTTTADCLWAGLPVVAMKGGHFASRVSQSLLHAAGYDELVAPDSEGMKNLILALVDDTERRQALKDDIVARRHSMALFDTHARASQLEVAYMAAWQAYCRGEAPADIHVPAG